MNPSLDLQVAIIRYLTNCTFVTELVGNRIYDEPPQEKNWTQAYIQIGDGTENDDSADCLEGVEVMQRIHIWSRGPGFVEVSRIADAVVQALHNQDIDLDHNVLVELRRRRLDRLRDPDGKSRQVVIEFTGTIEIPD